MQATITRRTGPPAIMATGLRFSRRQRRPRSPSERRRRTPAPPLPRGSKRSGRKGDLCLLLVSIFLLPITGHADARSIILQEDVLLVYEATKKTANTRR